MDRRSFISSVVAAVTSLFVKRQAVAAIPMGVDWAAPGAASQSVTSHWTYSEAMGGWQVDHDYIGAREMPDGTIRFMYKKADECPK